jgi:dihydroorotate dehydrogenase
MKSNKQINLSVKIGELVLKNPFILGSFDGLDSFCGLRRGYELSAGGFGAMVTKTATLQRREGYKRPRVAKFGSGYLVASGMKNFGIKKLSKEIRRFKN